MNNKQMDVVSPSDDEFEGIKSNVAERAAYKIDYNELAETYNDAEIGSIVLLEAGLKVRANNLIAIVKGRGLAYKKDFTAGKLMKDNEGNSIAPSERPIAVTKMTNKKMGLVGE